MSKYKVDITGINTSEIKVLSNAEEMDLFQKLKKEIKMQKGY